MFSLKYLVTIFKLNLFDSKGQPGPAGEQGPSGESGKEGKTYEYLTFFFKSEIGANFFLKTLVHKN